MIQLYTVPEVARMLRVKKGFIYELIYTGRLEALKLSGRRIRITEEAIKNYLDSLKERGRAGSK
ncbi:helix-turn-helix domain-containing protein [Desulfovirgula thermocuniculi]|uniref:helix-turn-helix domain-containing protein n=1 Tax=Desulfovirgula thermocuniculi TaxID=348842 RepID=UPI00042A50FC|nr:helix-turn-helix domain-containing protein [Desulfovirgula thermocuniculi]